MGGEGGRGPGPDESVSGQPYSAPDDHSVTDPKANVDAGFRYVAPTQAWGGNADPRNLSYEPEGLRYFGPGYEQPNDTPWDGRPPPQPPAKRRSWFARHKFWTGRTR